MTEISKVAIVTGSTQGLGEAIARQLIAEKLIGGLVICGRSGAKGRKLAGELSKLGCKVEYVEADLAQVQACQKIVWVAHERFGRIDYLVNSAATSERGGILDSSPELFDRMVDLNVRAPFFLMQEVLKIMVAQKIEGAIVNILSMSSHGGQPFLTPYSMSKGALATLTKNVAHSVVAHRIRVNGLNIGWMDSPGEHTIQKRFHDASDEWLDEAERQQPFGRLLKPQEVARVVAFLLSDRSGLLTGSIIDFDQHVMGTND